MHRLAFVLPTLLLFSACSSDACNSGKSAIHDQELYVKLVQSLREQQIEFDAIDGNVICYDLQHHDLVRAETLRIHQLMHPIGSRIDVARGMEEEVFESLNQAGVRYEWRLEKDWLVLIIEPEDFEKGDAALDQLFKRKFSGSKNIEK